MITLGGKLPGDRYNDFPGSPVVVAYAPQLELTKRAAVPICHAGNNTVLESLASGVPVIAVPLNTINTGLRHVFTIPARGAYRAEQTQRETILRKPGPHSSQPSYKQRAQAQSASLKQAGGEVRAADLIEQELGKARAIGGDEAKPRR